MGIRESKSCFLPYEEAVKRVSDEEMQRLRIAFKRCSGATGFMSQQIFAREVLGDGVPTKIAEHIFIAIGGTNKGLNFRDLVCGLVLLTRGTREEKIKFLFGVFSSDGVVVVKDTMESIILACDGGNIPQGVTDCFSQCDHLTFEEFSQWIQCFPKVTTLTTWLLVVSNGCPVPLTDNSETPTFYQTLAGATHLLETDIIELEKKYWHLKSASKSGKLDVETFSSFVSPPVPQCLCQGLFKVFDENEDGHIDFREMACGIAACCRGTSVNQQHFCFKVFDVDGDGFLSRSELESMMRALLQIKLDNSGERDCNSIRAKDVGLMASEVLRDCNKEEDEKIDFEDYKDWVSRHRFSQLFAKVLIQVCHIVLGLKPLTRDVELQVVKGWLDRENQRELKPGNIWYLVSTQWWRCWKEYVSYQTLPRRSSTSAIKKNGAIPNSQAKLIQVSAANPEQTWNLGNGKPRMIGRRESHPALNNSTVVGSGISTMNGHCVSGYPGTSCLPGPIDNSSLVEPDARKIMILTGEGGKLKKNVPLSRGRDFEILPDPLWRAFHQWYGGGPALPRTVITPTNGDPTPELELFPVTLRLYRHAPPPSRGGGITTWTGVGFGLSSFGFGSSNVTHAPPKRYLAYLATFSRMNTLQQVFDYLSARLRIRLEDMRLWSMQEENKLHLLEEDGSTLEWLGIKDNYAMLIEVRNRDMSWPEEMSSLAASKSLKEKLNNEPTEKGATGLSNLGNTCFMNSALQCLSNTQPLTQYFNGRCHLYELNRTNPLGAKGHLARRYGDLVEDLWSGSSKSLAPLKLRWTIGRYAPRFNGFQQHDSQEFLSFLLDGLHEDLNRVHDKPYVELKDSDGRPDEEVAREAWENHLKRNKSIVVDLFQGQLKSQVRCLECGNTSVRFDPFTFLSLPLPMDSSIYVEVVVILLEGSTPTKYGLLMSNDSRYKILKCELSKLCGLDPTQLLLVEVFGATVKSLPSDSQKIRSALGGFLYAYEVPLSPNCDTEVEIENPRSPDPERKIDVKSQCSRVEQLDKEDSCLNERTVVNDNECDDIKVIEIKDEVYVNDPINCGNSETCKQERHLRVDENWFSDNKGKTKSSNPLHRVSPKFKAKITPKFSTTFTISERFRKSSTSSSSEETSQGSACSSGNGNSDSGISSNTSERSPSNNRLYVPSQSNGSSRNSSVSSIGNQSPANGPSPYLGYCFNGFVVALHRKMIRTDAYFLSPQKNRPCLFGIPVIVPCTAKTKQLELYSLVWNQVSRLLSPPAPGDVTNNPETDGLYPFKLRAVQKDGVTCAWCPWYKFCRGCTIQCSHQEFGCGSSYIVIEWDPTTLHLRYQSSLEKVATEHSSVEESRRLQTEPIDLYECLKAFTKEEELGEEELWYCNKCKKHRLAVKKLDLWRLPPILVIHLKRFQFVNGHWVKSNKVVHYPMEGFDPSAFLVNRSTRCSSSVTMVTVKSSEQEIPYELCEKEIEQLNLEGEQSSDGTTPHSTSSSASSKNSCNCSSGSSHSEVSKGVSLRHSSCHSSCTSISSLTRADCISSNTAVGNLSLTKPGSMGESISLNEIINQNKIEGHANLDTKYDQVMMDDDRSSENETPTYKLYSMSCHTGVLGGGHYIAFAHNLNDKWYCYNDSSCKECDITRLQQDTPYLLFYERESISTIRYLPNINERTPDSLSDDEEYESEIKRLCTIQ